MLKGEDSRSQRLGRVARFHADGLLGENESVVVLLVYHMNCDTGDLCPRTKDRLMHVDPVHPRSAEGREQGRMDVDDPVPEARDDPGAQPLHVPGERNEVHPVALEGGQEIVVEGFLRGKLTQASMQCGDPCGACDLKGSGAGIVADDEGDGRWETAAVDGVENCLKIGPTPRRKDCYVHDEGPV